MTSDIEKYREIHGDQPQEALMRYPEIEEFVINTPQDSEYLAGISKACKKNIRAIEKTRKDILEPLRDSTKRTNEFFKNFKIPWETLEAAASGKVKAFVREQEAARLRAQNEAIRAAQEAQAAQAAAALASTPETVARAAEAVVEAQEVSRTALIEATTPDQGLGQSHRRSNFKAEVVDFKALVLSVAEQALAGNDAYLALLLPNTPALNKAAKAHKATGVLYPGVNAWDDFSIVG